MFGTVPLRRHHGPAAGMLSPIEPAADRLVGPAADELPASLCAAVLADPALGAVREAVKPGAMLFDMETPADEMFFIHRGQVRLLHLNPDPAREGPAARLVDVLGPGQWVGLAAVAGRPRHGARAQTQGQTVVSRFRGDRLLRVLAARPAALAAFTRELAGRLHEARIEADSFVFDDCGRRLLGALLRLGEGAAARRDADGRVVLHVTHQQLAHCVGVARETVSLALGDLRRVGVVETGRNRVSFDPAAVHRLRSAA